MRTIKAAPYQAAELLEGFCIRGLHGQSSGQSCGQEVTTWLLYVVAEQSR